MDKHVLLKGQRVREQRCHYLLACAIASMLVLAGCAQPGTPVVVECKALVESQRSGRALVGEAYGMSMTPVPLDSVQFGNGALARSMAVQGLHARRTATGTVQLQARFVSCSEVPSTVHMRTSFMRADMSPAEPASAWKPLHIQARATAVYEEFSTSPDAATYLIEVAP